MGTYYKVAELSTELASYNIHVWGWGWGWGGGRQRQKSMFLCVIDNIEVILLRYPFLITTDRVDSFVQVESYNFCDTCTRAFRFVT